MSNYDSNSNCGQKTGCNSCNSCNCNNACGCEKEMKACEDCNLDADKSWVFVTTENACGSHIDRVPLRCLKQFLNTIEETEVTTNG